MFLLCGKSVKTVLCGKYYSVNKANGTDATWGREQDSRLYTVQLNTTNMFLCSPHQRLSLQKLTVRNRVKLNKITLTQSVYVSLLYVFMYVWRILEDSTVYCSEGDVKWQLDASPSSIMCERCKKSVTLCLIGQLCYVMQMNWVKACEW